MSIDKLLDFIKNGQLPNLERYTFVLQEELFNLAWFMDEILDVKICEPKTSFLVFFNNTDPRKAYKKIRF